MSGDSTHCLGCRVAARWSSVCLWREGDGRAVVDLRWLLFQSVRFRNDAFDRVAAVFEEAVGLIPLAVLQVSLRGFQSASEFGTSQTSDT